MEVAAIIIGAGALLVGAIGAGAAVVSAWVALRGWRARRRGAMGALQARAGGEEARDGMGSH